jgi:hypothetical protein
MNSLRSWLRRHGVGRWLYRTVHRPLESLDLGRTYGWPLWWRATFGHRAMRLAAHRLPPLPVASDWPMTVCFLTGREFLHQTLFCAHSLVRHTGLMPRFEFYSDGSLTDRHTRAILRLFPHALVPSARDSEAAVRAALPPGQFPSLHAVRRDFVLLRKLTDAMAGHRDYRIFLDSDMLFWSPPHEWLALAQSHTPLYLTDINPDGYTATAAEITLALGVPAARQVNSGLIGLDAAQLDWPALERACAWLRTAPGDPRLLEQTLWAIALGPMNAQPLAPDRYRVLVDPPTWAAARAQTPEPALLHYAWQARLPYTASEWRRYIK